MNLNAETAFADLIDLVQKIGAPNVTWTPAGSEYIELPITIEDITSTTHPDIAAHLFNYPRGLIGVYGRQCLLYLPRGTIGSPAKDLPKFHFKECRTIKDMKSNGRFERYTATNRTSGLFIMHMKAAPYSSHTEKREVRLNVCKNCLKEFGFNVDDVDVENFDIESFFKECKNHFEELPSTYDGNIPPDIYLKNWDNISKFYRAQRGWQCEACGIDLSKYQKLLHVHHKNGIKTDTSPKNLIAVCVLCHSAQYQHGHMKPTEEERMIILKLRQLNDEMINKFKGL